MKVTQSNFIKDLQVGNTKNILPPFDAACVLHEKIHTFVNTSLQLTNLPHVHLAKIYCYRCFTCVSLTLGRSIVSCVPTELFSPNNISCATGGTITTVRRSRVLPTSTSSSTKKMRTRFDARPCFVSMTR